MGIKYFLIASRTVARIDFVGKKHDNTCDSPDTNLTHLYFTSARLYPRIAAESGNKSSGKTSKPYSSKNARRYGVMPIICGLENFEKWFDFDGSILAEI